VRTAAHVTNRSHKNVKPAPRQRAGQHEYMVGANANWMPNAAANGDRASVDAVMDGLQRAGARLVRTWAFNRHMPAGPGAYNATELA
jgi:hypothetical protein